MVVLNTILELSESAAAAAASVVSLLIFPTEIHILAASTATPLASFTTNVCGIKPVVSKLRLFLSSP